MMRNRTALNLALICLLLAGCAAPGERAETASEQPRSVDSLLQAARESTDRDQSQRYRLQAAERLQQQEEYESARHLLQGMTDEEMSGAVRDQLYLLSMGSILATGDRLWAGTLSQQLDTQLPARLPENIQFRAMHIQADTLLLANRPFDAAEVLILNQELVGEDLRADHLDRIWRHLRDTPEQDLEAAARRVTDHNTQAWLELALSLRADQFAAMETQSATIRRWQSNWSGHPAAENLPRELSLIASLPELRPRRMALALPLSGPLASAGQAVREGFMAAVYQEYGEDEKNNASVEIYDTNKTGFDELYADLLASNPDLVIGPLTKPELESLKDQERLPIPVLALNYLEPDDEVPEGLFQFGLSGEDEARQVAERLARDGHRNALLIAPRGEWGDRMHRAFRERHEQLDGKLVDTSRYRNNENLSQVVSGAFGINVSRQRANSLQRLLGTNMEFEPRRRQDIDAIVLLAPPATARQLNPLFAFYYGGDLPVYGTSLIYNGTPDPSQDGDLGGVHFTDIPWTLEPDDNLRPILSQLFPSLSVRYDRLFALGVDSFRLTGRLPLLEQVEGSWMNGHTGRLFMDERRAIYREQRWAQFRAGRPVMAPEEREAPREEPGLPGVQRIRN